jgi:hypothetical protein
MDNLIEACVDVQKTRMALQVSEADLPPGELKILYFAVLSQAPCYEGIASVYFSGDRSHATQLAPSDRFRAQDKVVAHAKVPPVAPDTLVIRA